MFAESADTIELPKRKRNSDDGELDVTPMIDVTFLLLAFFVVVSKMDPQASVPLPVASYGESISEKETVTIIVTVDDSGKVPQIFLGTGMVEEELVPAGDEDDRKQFIADYVETKLTEDPSKNAVLIRPLEIAELGWSSLSKRASPNPRSHPTEKSTLALKRNNRSSHDR